MIIGISNSSNFVEHMLKAGMREYVNAALCATGVYFGWRGFIRNLCGMLTQKADRVWRNGFMAYIGMTTKQLNAILERFHIPKETRVAILSNPVKDIGAILVSRDISSVDNKTFGYILDYYEEVIKKYQQGLETVNYICNVSGEIISSLKDYNIKLCKIAEYLCKIAKDHVGPSFPAGISILTVVIEYRDYLKIKFDGYNGMEKFPIMPENIHVEHAKMIQYYEDFKDASLKESFRERRKGWIKYEYKSDAFMVISPSKPEDLRREGACLHHCVGSYTDSVAKGNTNILFIRKREEPDKPFFTAEVDNNRYLVQLYGFGNRTADTEPCLIPFIKDWMEKNPLNSSAKGWMIEIGCFLEW